MKIQYVLLGIVASIMPFLLYAAGQQPVDRRSSVLGARQAHALGARRPVPPVPVAAAAAAAATATSTAVQGAAALSMTDTKHKQAHQAGGAEKEKQVKAEQAKKMSKNPIKIIEKLRPFLDELAHVYKKLMQQENQLENELRGLGQEVDVNAVEKMTLPKQIAAKIDQRQKELNDIAASVVRLIDRLCKQLQFLEREIPVKLAQEQNLRQFKNALKKQNHELRLLEHKRDVEYGKKAAFIERTEKGDSPRKQVIYKQMEQETMVAGGDDTLRANFNFILSNISKNFIKLLALYHDRSSDIERLQEVIKALSTENFEVRFDIQMKPYNDDLLKYIGKLKTPEQGPVVVAPAPADVQHAEKDLHQFLDDLRKETDSMCKNLNSKAAFLQKLRQYVRQQEKESRSVRSSLARQGQASAAATAATAATAAGAAAPVTLPSHSNENKMTHSVGSHVRADSEDPFARLKAIKDSLIASGLASSEDEEVDTEGLFSLSSAASAGAASYREVER
ncbi:MAG TPA: hypothetical protein VLG71_01770 [Candidatus Limnocylindria bacterium]|nr:hypothetical protein [Candidatus Limnocylindria bacterium]